jgi:hypothetical protein
MPEEWPPTGGKDFIRSDEFGRMLLKVVSDLSARYPQIDFTDAVAHVFAWFDRKLSKNRRYINSRRFANKSSFLAYLRQSVWNAGRIAARQRQRSQQVEALPADRPIVADKISQEELDTLLSKVESLPEPHKSVFERRFFEEDSSQWIASCTGRTEEEVESLYTEAIDLLICTCGCGGAKHPI